MFCAEICEAKDKTGSTVEEKKEFDRLMGEVI